MKKLVASILVLSFLCTGVFAAAPAVAISSPTEELTVQPMTSEAFAPDALFADIDTIALTDEEAAEVEGTGLFGFTVCSVLGGVIGGFSNCIANWNFSQSLFNTGWNYGVGVGAGIGIFLLF